jgi:hypothetical protein
VARLLTKVDNSGKVNLDVGKTLAGLVLGIVLVVVAYLLWTQGGENATNGTAVWTLATAVISGTLGLAVGEKATGGGQDAPRSP